jgi:hypothetical protein
MRTGLDQFKRCLDNRIAADQNRPPSAVIPDALSVFDLPTVCGLY